MSKKQVGIVMPVEWIARIENLVEKRSAQYRQTVFFADIMREVIVRGIEDMEMAPECEHLDSPATGGACPGCGLAMVYCQTCSDANMAGMPICHAGPACPDRR